MADRVVAVGLTANTAAYVAGMNKASAAASKTAASTEKLGSSVDKTRSKMNVFRNIALYAFGYAGVLGAIQAVGKGLKTVMDFEVAISELGAASMASAADLDLMRQAALDAGKNTTFTATQAAAAMTELSKAGVATSDILGGALAGALDLAAAGQVDVAFAAETAATAMVQFNLSGSQMSHVADLLAAGAGKAQGGVEELALALRQGGQVASMVGWSFEDTTTALTAFAAAGLLGSDAGTSLKTMLLRLARPSNQAAEVMQRYGLSVYDASGNMVGASEMAGRLTQAFGDLDPQARNAAMGVIFGTDAVRAANVLFANGEAGIARWGIEVNDAGYAAEQAARKTDNLAGDLNRLRGTLEAMTIDSSDGLLGALRDITQAVNTTLNAVDSFNKIFPTLESPRGDEFKFDLFRGLAFQLGDLIYYLDGVQRAAAGTAAPMSEAELAALEYGESIRFANRAAADSDGAAETYEQSLDAIEQAAADAEEELDALQDTILALGGEFRGAQAATDAVYESINDLMQPVRDLEAAQKNLAAATDDESRAKAEQAVAEAEAALALDGNSDAALDNRARLRELAEQTLTSAGEMVQFGEDVDGARALVEDAEQAVYDAARAMGYSDEQARDYARQLGLIPDDVTTAIAQFGMTSAQAAAWAYKGILDGIPRHIVTRVSLHQQGKVSHGGYYEPGHADAGGGYRGGWASDIAGYQRGGFVYGPGSTTSDSVLARLSRGEFVVNARAASDYGPLLEAINKGMHPAPVGGDTFYIQSTTESVARDIEARQRVRALARRVV